MKTVELNVVPDNLGNNWNNWSENGTLIRVTDYSPNRPITRKLRAHWTYLNPCAEILLPTISGIIK